MLFLSGLLISVVSVFGFVKFILRNPTRVTPKQDAIISPADGKIITAHRYTGKQLLLYKGNKSYKGSIKTLTSGVANEGYVVSIFMNIFNVHYNRIPYSGTVMRVTHSSGAYMPANSINASFQNEKTETIIASKSMTIKVVQVAGFLARRIETYVKRSDHVKTGQILGRINFGSQVTLILPANIKLEVKPGDKVKAGESIIAYPR